MLVGSRKDIDRARAFRKALGGGMRQAGILAAAGIIALEKMTGRLAEDHANARYLAEQISQWTRAEIELDGVQTNIVMFHLADGGDATAFLAALKQQGVLAGTVGPHSVRLVTHHDVDLKACEKAAAVLNGLLT